MSLSLVACGKENAGGGNVEMREQIYTDGVHVYTYAETDKFVVQNGESDYKIGLSSNPSEFERLAAEELVLFFEEATGVSLPIVTDKAITYGKSDKVICLGKNDYYKAAYAYAEELSTEGKTAYEAFCRKQAELSEISECDCFIRGVRIGARLLLDIVADYPSQTPTRMEQ
jgi:hypothetical protein